MPKTRIVVIEDHIMVRQFFANMLRDQLQLTVAAECATVAEGCAACLREKPELAVVDWALPDGKGFEVIRTVGAQLPRTRWLFISSNEQEHMVREAIELGVHGFVLKRADLSTLREAVTRVLAGETYYCQRSAKLYVEAMRSEASAVGSNLTTRERQVLRAFARGENLKELAERLELTVKTVNNVMTSIKEKLSLHEPGSLVRYAIKHGYVEEP
ncbi:MAG: response regulator transcription factor [Opitutae bacterium]|nr:response regulator transcription factor [Opitutae bacterium]